MMKDNNGITYNKFLLKTSKELKENEIIHLKKVRISISGTEKIISCLSYENIDYNNFLKKRRELKILKEKKEKEILEQELKKKKEEEINKKREEEKIKIKKIEENFRKERLEEESRRKKLEEEELNKKRKEEEELKRKKEEELKKKKLEEEELNKIRKEEELRKKKLEEELKKKKIQEEVKKAIMEDELRKKEAEEEEKKKKTEEELRIKQKEEERNALLNEDLNKETKLALANLKHEERRQRYNFKWEKGNLKWIDLSGKLSDLSNDESEKEKSLDLDFSSDTAEVIDTEIVDLENGGDKQKQKPIIKNKENEKEIPVSYKEENEDKKEIEDIFNGININELFKLNKNKPNQSKKLQQEFELIVNLSTKNNKKPIYVKCVKKNLLTKNKKNKILYYVFRDSEGAEINAYTYGENHIKNLDHQIQQNCVYIISRYRVTPLIYTSQINGNFRLILNSFTKIEPMPQDSVFNNIHFHFLMIEDLFFFKEGCIVDTCGIIYDEGEPRIYNMKNGQKFMRNVLIADSSMKKGRRQPENPRHSRPGNISSPVSSELGRHFSSLLWPVG